MDYQFSRHFTLAEANRMIPHIIRLFHEMRLLVQRDEDSVPPATAHYPANGNGHAHGNGNGNGNGNSATHSAADYAGWGLEKRREAAYRLLNSLQEQGIVIQDVERGLIDFPAIVDGREVFLCYELQDGSTIEYYHDLNAGFAGRQKISESRHD